LSLSRIRLPALLARRYFRSKKSTNAINVISYISIGGITVGTMALIIVLSVFNGFEGLVVSLYNQFSPDVVIQADSSKSFLPDDTLLKVLSKSTMVQAWSPVIEESVLLKYGNNQCIATLKGVGNNYPKVNDLPKATYHGKFFFTDENNNPFVFLGAGIEQTLSINYGDPFGFITIYFPKKGNQAVISPEDAFNITQVKPSGSFAIQQDFDTKYAFVSIDLMRELSGYTNQVNSIEVALKNPASSASFIGKLKEHVGNRYKLSNRYQQNEILYKVLTVERTVTYIFLSFILFIAGFNLIGILKVLGATDSFIRKVFLFEGLVVALTGYIIGAFLGFSICYLQQNFGFVKLQGGSFVVDAYPVSMHLFDFFVVFLTVLFIGFIASWIPSKRSSVTDLKTV
jgi:lipoprotein-releasing system permease protein